MEEYLRRLADSLVRPPRLDPLERSDREEALAGLLEGAGVTDPWAHAPRLVSQGVTPDDVERSRARLRPEVLAGTLTALASFHEEASLLQTLEEGSARIVGLVGARTSAWSVRASVNAIPAAPAPTTSSPPASRSPPAPCLPRVGQGSTGEPPVARTRYEPSGLPPAREGSGLAFDRLTPTEY